MQEIKEIRGEEKADKKAHAGEDYDYEHCGIVRDRAMVPSKNMFDFTYRPDNNIDNLNSKGKHEGTKSQILRKMSQMQRDFFKNNKKFDGLTGKGRNGGAY